MKKIILILVLVIFIIGCAEKECEIDADCTDKTCFTVKCKDNNCIYSSVSDCCGNDKCEQEETYESCSDDCPNCDDNDTLTIDRFNYKTQECENTELLIKKDLGDYKYVKSMYGGGGPAELELYSEEGEQIGTIKCGVALYNNSIGQEQIAVVCPYDNRQDATNSLKGMLIRYAPFVSGEYKGEKVYRVDKEVIIWTNNAYVLTSGMEPGSGVPPAEAIIDAYLKKYPNDVEGVNCPYECCEGEIYNPKTCAAGSICYENKCYSKDEEIEILKDTKFEWGFINAVGASNLPDDTRCEMPIQGKKPVWATAEIATETHFCKNLPNPKSTEPILFESENGYKKLYSYKDGRIKLQLDSSAEEKQGCVITNPRDSLTNWIDYGVRQYMIIDFADFEELNFNADVKLNKFKFNIPKQKCSEYGSIVDRYGEFLIVFSLKRKDNKEPNKWFWLLLPICQKHWWPGASERGASEHKDCTSNRKEFLMDDQFGIPMYHPAMDTGVSPEILEFRQLVRGKYSILKEGEWVNYNFDLKELAEDAVKYYNNKNDPDINLYDYNLVHVAFDWEIVGGFDTDIELKDSSLKGKLVSD